MDINKKDLRIEYMRGTGPGGMNKNKLETACRITHKPSGITAYCDDRKRRTSFKQALAELVKRLAAAKAAKIAQARKARRDYVIHNTKRVRTYDYKSGVVKDHRTGKTASLKDVLFKGRLDLLR